MAIRSRKKISAAGVRHSVHRREQQVQGLDNQTLQTLKAAFTHLQETLDSDGNARSKWLGGSLWADLYTRSGTFIGTLHYSLPEQFLCKIGVQHVRLEAEIRGFRGGGREDFPVIASTQRGGLLGDAGAGVSEHTNFPSGASDAKISGRGRTVHNRNGGGKARSGKRGSRRNKMPTDGKRSRVQK